MPRTNMLNAPNRLFLLFSLTWLATLVQAQSKVFKEVGEDVATTVKAITQDNNLVGYLAFTQLEKTDADSLNYRLTIMDENLNDIGTVNFRQRKLELQAVSFEQDVLCLGYVESSTVGVLTEREKYRASRHTNVTDQLLFQFVNLSGKVINRYTTPVVLSANNVNTGFSFKFHIATYLKHEIQLKNIPGTGFAAFYGDENKREVLVLDAGGRLVSRRKIAADLPSYLLETSGTDIYILSKMHINTPEGGFRLYTYTTVDSTKEFIYDLKDKQGNWLKVLSFDNDPSTGNAFIAGCVINPDREKDFLTAHDYTKSPYLGVFSMTLGTTQSDMKTVYSYWSKGNMSGVDQDGLFTSDNNFYAKYSTAFKDFDGITVFVASALVQSRHLGLSAYDLTDALFVRQETKGQLKVDNRIPCDKINPFGPGGGLYTLDHKDFYKVVNRDTKTNFIIIDDKANIYIYNFNSKKVVRTISHKDGHTVIHVYPAKEGHILVSEYDSKGKQTRFSIEAL